MIMLPYFKHKLTIFSWVHIMYNNRPTSYYIFYYLESKNIIQCVNVHYTVYNNIHNTQETLCIYYIKFYIWFGNG